MKAIELIEKKHMKEKTCDFNVGDKVKVHLKVKEGDKTRIQIFEGIVIRRRGTGVRESFTVLKSTRGSSYTVEKTFPLHSPVIEKIKVVTAQKARRSKLYHLRSK